MTEEFSQIEGIGKKNMVASSDKLSNSVCLINVLQEKITFGHRVGDL